MDEYVGHSNTQYLSAKEAIKVEAAFLEAAQMALQQETAESQIFIPETIQLSTTGKKDDRKKSSGGCC
jgi:hypothetical protein